MPIRRHMRHFYGKEWKEVHRPRILARAMDDEEGLPRCECVGECRREHAGGRCAEIDGEPAASFNGPVVLTVAHLDQNPANNDDSNLRALCQRCHNRVDQPHRQVNAAVTRWKRKVRVIIASGQTFLFGEPDVSEGT